MIKKSKKYIFECTFYSCFVVVFVCMFGFFLHYMLDTITIEFKKILPISNEYIKIISIENYTSIINIIHEFFIGIVVFLTLITPIIYVMNNTYIKTKSTFDKIRRR